MAGTGEKHTVGTAAIVLDTAHLVVGIEDRLVEKRIVEIVVVVEVVIAVVDIVVLGVELAFAFGSGAGFDYAFVAIAYFGNAQHQSAAVER